MKRITLSDAILKGCKMRPNGGYYGRPGYSCVLGAVADALNISPSFEGLVSAYPELEGWGLKMCSENSGFFVGGERLRLFAILIFLNDTYGWSREKIAKWLQGYGL